MKRVLVAVLLSVAVMAVALAIYVWQSGQERQAGQIDADYIGQIHMRLDPRDIPELEEIIESDADNYTRERAVFVLTDIVVRTGMNEDVVAFLKGIAYNEKNDEVRSAAYANLYLIREYNPPSVEGSFNVSIEGPIYQGNTVDMIVSVSSGSLAGEAIVGIRRVAKRGYAEGAQGISISTPNPLHFSLKAGETREARFSLDLRDEGEYLIRCVFELSIDRIDYQTMERQVLLRFDRYGGSYEVQE